MRKVAISLIRQPVPLDMLLLIVFGTCISIYILNLIFWRLFKHLLDITIGSCLTLSMIGLYIYTQTDDAKDLARARTRKIRQNLPSYDLLDDSVWNEAVTRLSDAIPNKLTIFSESFLLSDAVGSLIELVMRDFVLSWYQRAFKDDVFPAHVERVIREATVELGNRVKNVPWTDMLVRKVTPLITEHLDNYVNAVEIVREKSTGRRLVESKELDMVIAQKYGKLHDAVMISDTGYEETSRENWLKVKIEKILPLLIRKSEVQSSLVANLARDIIACNVLSPVLSMLCSPDFINQKFTDAARKALQDRLRVAQLREVLDAHATSTSISRTRKRAVSGAQTSLRLSPNADQAAFEKFIRGIKKCQSLPDARQIRFYIAVQIQRAAKTGNNALYEQRLKEAKQVIESRLSALSSQREIESTENENGKNDPRYSYTLDDILKDSMCSSFFMEYMDQKHKTILVQFLLTVNILREPLGNDYDEDTGANTDPLGGLEVAGQSQNKLQSHKNDILQINEQYFRRDANDIDYSDEAYDAVYGYALEEEADYSQYQAALAAILKTQSHVHKAIEQNDVRKFKESDLFIKYLASSPFVQLDALSSSIDQLQLDHVGDADEDTSSNLLKNELNDSMLDLMSSLHSDDHQERNIVEVEKALNNIMMKPDKEMSVTTEKSSLTDNSLLRRFKLFDEDDADSDSSSQMMDYEPKNEDLQIRMATPGDLTLTEAIKALSADINRLYDQQMMVNKLITKAELTNNTTDLRILQKSHTSLEREIQLKELQRQQFYVQESENSLFGRSETRIDSYITSMDSNGPFTMYIIEVQRFDTDGIVTAGWIVGRRYNQFYQLHQHLKHQFADIRSLSFPKKRVALKFQPKTFVDARRQALERYLNELLKNEEVCRSKALRLFLSSDNFSVNHGKESNGYDSDDSMTPSSTGNSSMEILPILDSETDENEALKPFVQPLCDLFIQVLGFGTKENWMKGRAVIIILQQLLGGRIEKKVREVMTSLTSESRIVEFVHTIQESVWPNGERRNGPKYERTSEEKATTKRQAEITISELFDSIGVVVGRSSARYAARNVFSMIQNETLNYHLMFNVLEVVFDELFPEIMD